MATFKNRFSLMYALLVVVFASLFLLMILFSLMRTDAKQCRHVSNRVACMELVTTVCDVAQRCRDETDDWGVECVTKVIDMCLNVPVLREDSVDYVLNECVPALRVAECDEIEEVFASKCSSSIVENFDAR